MRRTCQIMKLAAMRDLVALRNGHDVVYVHTASPTTCIHS